jgi:hypothetical protein
MCNKNPKYFRKMGCAAMDGGAKIFQIFRKVVDKGFKT